MSVRRRNSGKEKKPMPRRSRQARQVVGAPARVRVVPVEPRPAKTPHPVEPRTAQKRATFDIAAPRLVLNPWQTKRDWKASRPKFAASVLIVVLIGTLYAMFNSDLFFVGEPVVIGNKLVTRQEAVQVSGMSGWNIFFVEPHAVENAVHVLPEFKDVQVYVTLPNIVEIYATERIPRFVWEVAGKNYWIDDDGIAMRPRGMVQTGWHVRDAEGKAVKYGERINPDAFNAAVSLINVWKDSPKYFEWTKAHGLTLRDEHGWQVYFGSATQMPDKVTALNIVTMQLLKDKRKVTFVDLGSGLPYYQEVAKASQ